MTRLYKGIKLAQRDDARDKRMNVIPGMAFTGFAWSPDLDKQEMVQTETIKPIVGYAIALYDVMQWLKTTAVTAFYIVGEEEDGNDKVVLPSWAPMDILKNKEFKQGDAIIQTKNSFYYFENLGDK